MSAMRSLLSLPYSTSAHPSPPPKKKEKERKRKRKKEKLLHDLLGILRSMYAGATLRTSSSTGGCGLAGRKLRMQPEEATVKCRLLEWNKHTLADVECHR
ncbi:hypothetical protein BDV27DRAFT_139351 [Aspergillus caelatus]|uniref:Uncharacterized protein n=1 Tax=Aspergillus caelatus TaxID=61420 RepID=A0A5N6ZIG5_9EURO|nr:uncharacterized protein BDV27DRAFT_139351 [Aspergillus caelatus]KAE8357427.1 hypothetical protein BDV27DRAFT_139351 [Aspergillus caelatus]